MAVAIQKRARSEEQKELRRREILEAADAHLSAAGFEAFSMAAVGKLASVAKGTLYLYFATREELLLELYLEKLNAWQMAMLGASIECRDDRSFATAFLDAAYQDPSFLRLSSRLDSVIEHNVSLPALIAAKRAMAAMISEVADSVAGRLTLSTAQTFDAIAALAALLLGVSQIDAGPRLENEELPDDVKRLVNAFSARKQFVDNACRILAGIRTGA